MAEWGEVEGKSDCQCEQQFDDDFNNLSNKLPDSELYLRSLELKLQKVQGKNRELTARDVIDSLSKSKLSAMEQFLNQPFPAELSMSNGNCSIDSDSQANPIEKLTLVDHDALQESEASHV